MDLPLDWLHALVLIPADCLIAIALSHWKQMRLHRYENVDRCETKGVHLYLGSPIQDGLRLRMVSANWLGLT